MFRGRELNKVALHALCGVTLFIAGVPVWAADAVTINLEGVENGELRKNILAYLSLEQQKSLPRLSSNRIKQLHKLAPEEIKKAVQPFGYYRVSVTPVLTAPNAQEQPWQAQYSIDLGKPVTLQRVELQMLGEGKDDPELQAQAAKFPLKINDVLVHSKYEQGKRALRNLAEERGYFHAQFTQQRVEVDEAAGTAQILLRFETGKRSRFGAVNFQQNMFEESVLQRFMTFQSQDFYSGTQLLGLRNALVDSDYFEEVDIDAPRPDPQHSEIPVTVKLKPRPLNKYYAGLGYGTDTGPRGSLGWERRQINRWGHRFSLDAQLSQIRNAATARYYIPTGSNKDDFYAISTGYKDEHTKTSDNKTLIASAGLNQNRTLWGDVKVRELLALEYRDERYSIAGENGHSRLLMPTLSWTYVQADDRIYTRRGQKVQWELRGAMDKVVSNTSFVQTKLSGIVIRSVGESGRILLRGDMGYTYIPQNLSGDFNELPVSVRFFAGGDRSVRGYDYNSLGSKNAAGQVIGAKNLLVGSAEYEHRILDKWSLAAFYDVGNALNSFNTPLKHGTGVGVRWQSPVGLIRVDVATALSEPGKPLRLHVTIGPDL
jgi:translocation and assembly module TamA